MKRIYLTYEINWRLHGFPFICTDAKLLSSLNSQIEPVIGKRVLFDAKGATSDGRFLTKIAPCFEIGFQEEMAHKVNESVDIEDIKKLLEIYINLFKNIVF